MKQFFSPITNQQAMKKIVILVALIATVFGTANAQRGRRGDEERDRDNRSDDRRGQYDNRYDDRRGQYDNRYDDRRGQYDNRYDGRNPYNRVDEFQRESRRRIAEGVARGLISSREARNLLRFAERIERKEQIFWRDGQLDRRERRDLVEDLAALNREITHEKYDGERSTYDDQYNQNRRRW
jgi:hypothetical protein